MIVQKILIFSASIGNGHNQAAKALSEEFEKSPVVICQALKLKELEINNQL
ncbi:hypothetical protein ACFO0S_06965 [Chryseomicrobium palamuruense]|uniref:Diacylglycerol glucosyltransferase N-terminal domain-containing protein n=1 Tax=Chryseomicrobium palamuruense TaxID=682973 RepID=A0ABV8UWB4_9BACL